MSLQKIRTDVLISSTSIDLPEYREAVIKTILGLGLFPVGMETWPQTGENPVDKCKRMVNESEIYIGIYAYRYGWQPDGFGGKSITELEYDWAGEKGIPRLCFIMSDKHPWPEARKEKAKQKELDAFIARVKADEVGFFTTPENLAKQVAIALAGVQVTPKPKSEISFDTIAEQIEALLDESQPNWKQLETKFSQLTRFIGTNSQYRADYEALKQRFNEKRQSLFDAEYEQVQDDMSNLSNTEFDQRVKHLIELGGGNDTIDARIADLKARRRSNKNVNYFVAKARKNLQAFESQVANNMDKQEALIAFLAPIKVEGERLLQEGGDNPALTAILAELRQAEKAVNEQIAISTPAALGEFEKVLAFIEAQPDNQEIDLIGVGGAYAGHRKKLDAIAWYEERAREYEEKKADEYLTRARQELNDGHPIIANQILLAAEALKRLSPQKQREISDFLAQQITPVMNRVRDARMKLVAVSRANSLRESIRLFDEALDEKTGWPEFDTIGNHKKQAGLFLKQDDTSSDEGSLVGDALTYIYMVMEREFQQWQGQTDLLTVGHRLYYTATQQQITDLQYFIDWRDKRLAPAYRVYIARLVESYNQQAKQVHDLNEAVSRALGAFNQGNYTLTYDLLLPYVELLEVEKAKYIDGYNLWIKVRPFVDIEIVRQELNAILAQGIINPNLLDGELSRLEVARDKGMSIVNQTPDKALATGLTRTAKDVASLYDLVRGLYERQRGNLATAETCIEQSIQGFSHEYPDYVAYAKEILVELKGNIKDDQELLLVIDAAKRELEANRIQNAYDLLLPHEGKITSPHYTEYLNLMSIIRPKLSEEEKQVLIQQLSGNKLRFIYKVMSEL